MICYNLEYITTLVLIHGFNEVLMLQISIAHAFRISTIDIHHALTKCATHRTLMQGHLNSMCHTMLSKNIIVHIIHLSETHL